MHPSEIQVSDAMTRPVASILLYDSLNQAAQLLWEKDCGILPVLDAEERLVGVITDRDICMGAYFKGLSLNELRVSESMSCDLATCESNDTLESALQTMRERRVRRLPVVDSSFRVLGMLSLSDLVRESQAIGSPHFSGLVLETLGGINLARPVESRAIEVQVEISPRARPAAVAKAPKQVKVKAARKPKGKAGSRKPVARGRSSAK